VGKAKDEKKNVMGQRRAHFAGENSQSGGKSYSMGEKARQCFVLGGGPSFWGGMCRPIPQTGFAVHRGEKGINKEGEEELTRPGRECNSPLILKP